jgi:hypothetical protein
MRFFLELDLLANDSLWTGPYDARAPGGRRWPIAVGQEWFQSVTVLGIYLDTRLKNALRPDMFPAPALTAPRLQALRVICRDMEALARATYAGSGVDVVAGLSRAFELFAGGQIRYLMPPPVFSPADGVDGRPYNGEPNGGNFFIFGELAALACLHVEGAARDFWLCLAPATLYTRAIFHEAYSPTGAAAAVSLSAYKPLNFRAPSLLTEAGAARLRAEQERFARLRTGDELEQASLASLRSLCAGL